MRPSEPPRRLLALELDGTLLRLDGSVDPRDRAAVARARRHGAVVTLATARLPPAVLPLARSLRLSAPLICADGGAIVDPRRGEVLARSALGEAALAALLEGFAEAGLAPFVCVAEAVIGGPAAEPLAPWVGGWSRAPSFRPRLDAAELGAEALIALGLGAIDRVEAAWAALLGEVDAELAVFALGERAPWALRAQPRGAEKGAALARVAASLRVPRADVAAVGDGLNDLGMLAWAGRSFAMAHSLPAVRAAAGEVLAASAGGGVAEAVARWLG